jgi:phenylpyruvate tautomerase PptA (4-oxalocrotonate tautomerase family)
MPLVRLETTEKLADEARARLCAELSRTAADLIGKPETYVMAVVTDGVTMQHAGTLGSAAFIDVRSIGGLSPQARRRRDPSARGSYLPELHRRRRQRLGA